MFSYDRRLVNNSLRRFKKAEVKSKSDWKLYGIIAFIFLMTVGLL